MKVLAILQARTSSTRLPGKVLKPLAGKPMIVRMAERVRMAAHVNAVVVATSSDPSDDRLADILAEHGIDCFRGSLQDVLGRFCAAFKAYGPAEAVMRLTGDCPLIDWRFLDQLVELYLSGKHAYCSNVHPPTFPDGMDAEIFSSDALQQSCREATSPYDREHVTPYIIDHPERFPRANLVCPLGDLSWHRLTVDEPVDYEKVCRIFEALYPKKPDFVLEDILEFLQQHPDIMHMNQHIGRNEGAQREQQP